MARSSPRAGDDTFRQPDDIEERGKPARRFLSYDWQESGLVATLVMRKERVER